MTCIFEGNTGSDAAPVPFMDDEEADDDIIPEEETDSKNLGPNIQQLPDAVPEVSTFPIQQHAEAIFIPPTPPTSNLSKSEELSSTAEDDVVTSGVEVHPDPSPSEACPLFNSASKLWCFGYIHSLGRYLKTAPTV